MSFRDGDEMTNIETRWLQRIFRICPFDESRNIGLWRRVIDHTLAGGILGILLLHPLSMIAHNFFHPNTVDVWQAVKLSFSYGHIDMTVYFILVGSVIGMVHGSYVHIISKLYEEIRMLAISDELTGLNNRRFFMNRLDQEVARAHRYQHPLSLLMIDIDYFKRFNDTHGHPAGDELLRALGQLFRSLIRESDFAARYGGEEFAIVMPETGNEMAHALAQRICEAVSNHPFPHRDSQPGGKVTISVGMAELQSDEQTMESVIRNADQALYDAKAKGKNRVCKFEAEGERMEVIGLHHGCP